MKTNEGKILATGGWYSKKDCPDTHYKNGFRSNAHFFIDKEYKKGKAAGEKLLTSVCKYCGGVIKDCPFISV